MNRCRIEGKITEFELLRYSPAGVPIVEFSLDHESEQMEALGLRKAFVKLQVLAAGPIAVSVSKQYQEWLTKQEGQLAPLVVVEGFLAAKRLGSSAVRLHLTSLEVVLKK